MDFADQVCHFFLPIRCLWHNSSNMAPGPLMPFTHICQTLPLLVVFHKLLHHFLPLLIVTHCHLNSHTHHPHLAQYMPPHSPLAPRRCLAHWYTSLVWHALCPFTSILSFIILFYFGFGHIFSCVWPLWPSGVTVGPTCCMLINWKFLHNLVLLQTHSTRVFILWSPFRVWE